MPQPQQVAGLCVFQLERIAAFQFDSRAIVALYLDQGSTILAADPKTGTESMTTGTKSVGTVPGLWSQPLSQQFDLGRKPREHFDSRSRSHLGKKDLFEPAISHEPRNRMMPSVTRLQIRALARLVIPTRAMR